MSVKNRIQELQEILNKHNISYYVYDEPTISDYQYDLLLKELESLEKKHPDFIAENSPTQRVGGQPLSSFQTIKHTIPMLSLANAMNQNELEAFDVQIKKFLNTNEKIEYIGEPKLDGLAVELVYKNGIFSYGSTRGDGINGENITENLKTIKGIPLKLDSNNPPKNLEVRGEVYIDHQDFKRLNKERLKNNDKIFANPRNCAAGSLRQLDPKITSSRPLKIFCYGLGSYDGFELENQKQFLDQLKKWGFPVNSHIQLGFGYNFLKKYYNHIENLRSELLYDIDGVVFKVNSFYNQNILGNRSKSPRWAIAGKLKAQQAVTKVLDIDISVGRLGALTPVAKLEPISVGGVIISNATLHNEDEVIKKDVRIGDYVLIQRAGDVIPEIVKIIIEKRNHNNEQFKMPSYCPVCNGNVLRISGEAEYKCQNKYCIAKIKGSIQHYVSKPCMNIDGLGEKIIALLLDNKLISNFSDLYNLNIEQIASLDRMGTKSAENIITAINDSKKSSLDNFINGLGISHIGQNASKKLSNHFKGDIHLLINATKEELLNINEIGDIMANSLINYFSDEENMKIIYQCIDSGLHFQSVNINTETSIFNKTFVFTGHLESISRSEASKLIEKFGAKSSSSVSKKTHFVVAGKKAGSKLKKAKDLGIKIFNENEFIEFINQL